MSGRNQHRARAVFIATNGPGPWVCSACGEIVERLGRRQMDGNIHHLDEDKSNDVPENLQVLHVICHQRQHHLGAPASVETRAKMSVAQSGRVFTDEHRANISAGKRGRSPAPFTDEHRRRIGDGHRGMKRSDESRRRMSEAQRGRTASITTRAKMSAARRGKPKTQRRFKCGDCDLVTTGSALYQHQKATAHDGKFEVSA